MLQRQPGPHMGCSSAGRVRLGWQRVLGDPKQGAQPRYFGLCTAAKLFLDLSPAGEAGDVSPAAVWGNSGVSVKCGLLPFSFQETMCFRQKAAGKLWHEKQISSSTRAVI